MKAGMIGLLAVGMMAAGSGCAMEQPAVATNATAKVNTPVVTNTPAVTSTPAVTATTNAATAEKRVVVSTPATNTVTKVQEPAKK